MMHSPTSSLGALGCAMLLAAWQAAPLSAQAPQMSVTVACPADPAPAALGTLIQSGSLTATALNPPASSYGSQVYLASWNWTSTVQYAATPGAWGAPPGGAACNVSFSASPLTNPTTVSMTALSTTAGYWQVTPSATVTYRDNNNMVWTATGTGAPIVLTVVAVDHLQFQLPGGAFQNMPAAGLYVATGTSVAFQAVPSPAGASWPAGNPTWGGTCGASGTGPTVSVALNTPSQSMSDTQTITATCGNTVTALIVRYGPDQGTLDWNWDAQQTNQVDFNITFQLWVPDFDGTGRPYADGGYANLKSIDFSSLGNLPNPPPLLQHAQFPFNNGQSYTITTPAFTVQIYQPWLHEVGPAASSRPGRSLSDALAAERADTAGLLGQAPPPDPLSAAIAQLTKGAFPGKEAADKVIALIVDYYTNNAIAIKPDGTATGTTTIVPDSTDQTKNVPVTLTVTTVASQTPIGAKIGLKNNLSVSTFAVLDVDKFMSNTFNYFATPMVAIGDSNQILCGIKGPVFPTAGNFTASTGNLTKGPTPFMAVRPLAPAQPGYVYGAGNYTTVPAVGAARAYWYDNKTAVTTAIKATDGTPLFFDNQLSRVRMHVALSGPNDPKGNGLKITATKLGDVTTYYGDYDQLNPTFNADLISATQTIPWK